MIRYYLEIFAGPAEPRRQVLLDALGHELRMLGMARTVAIVPEPPPAGEPGISVYFGDPSLAADPEMTQRVAGTLASDRAVIPVVDDLSGYRACVPGCLKLVNGFGWAAADAGMKLARAVLEGLGIEERQRRVFISHKRDDGMAVAEQLHEQLSRHGFFPFIDRFHIPPGRRVPMPGWATMVSGPDGATIVHVTPRVPTVDDLYELDRLRAKFPGNLPGVLIHAPRHIPAPRRDVLLWAGASHDLTLVPENAIGGYWRRSDVR